MREMRMGLVEEAIQRAKTDTICPVPSAEDAYLRQCCDRVWFMIRDRLVEHGEVRAADLVQKWCGPDWVWKSGVGTK